MRHTFSSFVLFFLSTAACGGEQTEGLSGEGAPITLHPLDKAPACPDGDASLARFELEGEQPTTDEQRQLLSGYRQQWELSRSFGFQRAQLAAKPLLANPRVTSWSYEELGVRHEGAILARGTDWAVIKSTATISREGTVEVFDATIDTNPERTIFDFGDRALELRPHLLRYQQGLWGCDLESGTTFHSGYPIVASGAVLSLGYACWNMPASEDGSPLAVRCAQAIARAQL